MEIINNYQDFRFNLLLEQVESGEQKLVLSSRLKELLININHPIAEKLISSSSTGDTFKVTLLDYHDTDIDKFLFTASSKAILEPKTAKMWTKNRVASKIGRTVSKMYPQMFPNTGDDGIESFVEKIKIERTKSEGNFKVVEGDDIVKYYLNSNYAKSEPGSTLRSSCMGYERCSDYVGFYANNPVKMLMLMDDEEEGKIRGRAILWQIDEINGDELDEPRTFMDRIYTIDSYEIGKFIEYAKQNEFLYRETQNAVENAICDPVEGICGKVKMTSYDIEKHKAYPFMDTMKFYSSDEEAISNDIGFDYNMTFESTDGGYLSEDDGMEYIYSPNSGFVGEEELLWSDVENRNLIASDPNVWSEYIQSYASEEYAEENWTYSEEEQDWIPTESIVKIEGTDIVVSNNKANRDYAWVEKTRKYYRFEDVEESNEVGFIPKRQAVKVYEDIDLEEDIYDWRYYDKNDYFIYMARDVNSVYMDNSLIDNFVKVEMDLDGSSNVYMLKEEDKDRYIKWDGKYWNILLQDDLKKE